MPYNFGQFVFFFWKRVREKVFVVLIEINLEKTQKKPRGLKIIEKKVIFKKEFPKNLLKNLS